MAAATKYLNLPFIIPPVRDTKTGRSVFDRNRNADECVTAP